MASKSFTFEDGPNFRGTTRRSTVGGLDEPEIAAPQRGGVPDFRLVGLFEFSFPASFLYCPPIELGAEVAVVFATWRLCLYSLLK